MTRLITTPQGIKAAANAVIANPTNAPAKCVSLPIAELLADYLAKSGGTLTGDLLFTDAAHDIGKSGATRPRDGFFSRDLVVGGTITAGGRINTAQYGSIYFPALSWHYEIGATWPESLRFLRNGVVFAQMLGGTTTSGAYCSGLQLHSGTALSWGSVAGASTPPDLILVRDAADTLAQRRTTSAQTFRLYNTYTSTTSFENLQIKANTGAAYQIGSAVGSAGGTTRGIDLGYWNAAGTWVSSIELGNSYYTYLKGGIYFWSSGNNIDAAMLVASSAATFVVRGPTGGDVDTTVPGFQSGIIGFAGTHVANSVAAGFRYGGANAIRIQTTHLGAYGELQCGTLRHPAGTLSVTSPSIISPPVASSGTPTGLTYTGATHTTLAASTEFTDINFNLGRTVQFAAGALTTQRAFRIQAPTYSFVDASTITTASTVSISGPPVAGTNATITHPFALNVESGNVRVAGRISSTDVYCGTNGQVLLGGTSGGVGLRLGVWTGIQWANQYYDTLAAGVGCTIIPASSSILRIQGSYCGSNSFWQRNGTTAQTIQIYNTFTSDTSNEFLQLRGVTSNNFEIGPQNGSAGGTLRGLTIGGYLNGSGTITGWAQFEPNTSTGVLNAFYLGPRADNTATGGNARGANAVDLQISRSAANQVASGLLSIAGGSANVVSGQSAVGFGISCTASSTSCIAIGNYCRATDYGAMSLGINGFSSGNQAITISNGNSGATANALLSIAIGEGSLSDRQSLTAWANGRFAANGDAQSIRILLRNKTTNATPTTLFSNGSSTRLTIPSGKTLSADITISGIKSDGSAKATFWRKVVITNVGGTTTLDMEIKEYDAKDTAAVDVTITADDTNDALQINVTGVADETWRWVAIISGVEVAYGV